MANYKISKRIGRGGMAEVFLAVQEGLGGFEKLVVIKRIFPQYCDDEHFVAMFLQEARLAASIHHPNVVHINDIDRDDEGYYLVMEYLPGESLAYIWEALKARKQLIPPNIACRIGASVASGLHHAHIATDAAGHPQPIVHRDVTPSNLIVCFNGVVKIVDFGVAKATLTEGQTRAGALKGKMSYLSPEQIRDEPIDGRTDVFQLGVVMHEMLTGRRLFRGKNDHAKITSVMEKEIAAPSEFNPRVPRILDDVVLKALARDKAKRYQTADDMRRDFDNALGELGSVVSDSDVGEWLRTTLAERHAERLALERTCVSQIREGRPQEGSGSGTGYLGTESSSRVESPKDISGAAVSGAAGLGMGGPPSPTTPAMATVLEHQSRSAVVTSPGTKRATVWTIIGIAVFVGFVGVFAWRLGGEDGSSAGAASTEAASIELDAEPVSSAIDAPTKSLLKQIHVTAHPESADIFVDNARIGTGYAETEIAFGKSKHTLRVAAVGYETYEEDFVGDKLPKVIRLRALKRSGKDKPLKDDPPIKDGDESGDEKPADKKPGDKKPSDKKPSDKKPGDKKPSDKKPADKKPVDKKDFFDKTDNINPFD